jgi:hypothetical protein
MAQGEPRWPRLAELRVHVGLGHRAGLDGGAQFA